MMTKEPETRPEGDAVQMTYRNWRGEVAEREIVPVRVWWGNTEWHPQDGWLLSAWDVEKGAHRDFALADCQFISDAGDVSKDRPVGMMSELGTIRARLDMEGSAYARTITEAAEHMDRQDAIIRRLEAENARLRRRAEQGTFAEGIEAAAIWAGEYHWNRYRTKDEGGVLAGPAVFTSHTWQNVQEGIRSLAPAVTARCQGCECENGGAQCVYAKPSEDRLTSHEINSYVDGTTNFLDLEVMIMMAREIRERRAAEMVEQDEGST